MPLRRAIDASAVAGSTGVAREHLGMPQQIDIARDPQPRQHTSHAQIAAVEQIAGKAGVGQVGVALGQGLAKFGWRKLDQATREQVADAASARALMLAQPSVIKRPVIRWGQGGGFTVGFAAGFKPPL